MNEEKAKHTPESLENSANARLIAAAPELLAALEMVETQLLDALVREGEAAGKTNNFPVSQLGRAGEALRQARAAIAKAKGE
jgi:hypothetical protein